MAKKVLPLVFLWSFSLAAHATSFVQDTSYIPSAAVTTITSNAITVTAGDTLIAVIYGSGPDPTGTYVTCSGFTFAASMGNSVSLTLASAPSSGATSATLASSFGGKTGSYPINFSDNETRWASFTNGSTAVSWTNPLASSVTTSTNISENSPGVNAYYELNASGGSTTVSCTAGSASIQGIYVAEYSGIATSSAFLGATGGLIVGPGTTTDAIKTDSLSTASTPFVIIGYSTCFNTGCTANAGTNFTARTTFGSSVMGNYIYPEDYQPTSGTSFSATWTTSSAPSSPWSQIALEFKSAGASCTHSGITSAGAIAVPNGTSGSYRLKNGTFGTPDCSTISYYQTRGDFGVN